MPQLRVALAQIDTTVGDLPGNADAVLRWTQHAAGLGAHLVAFPALTLTGLPPQGLAWRPAFAAASGRLLSQLATRLGQDGLGETAVAVGFLDREDGSTRPHQATALCYGGQVVARQRPQGPCSAVRLHGVDAGMAAGGEPLDDGGPAIPGQGAAVGVLVVLAGSPYERDGSDARERRLRRWAEQARTTVCWVNAVGGQDELVFDGGSLIVDAAGELSGRAPQFEQGCLLADLDAPSAPAPDAAAEPGGAAAEHERITVSEEPVAAYEPLGRTVAPVLEKLAATYAALVTGTRDYVRKNGFPSVILGLSGGIDSALTATIACDAVGPEATYAVALPSRHSSAHSVADAEELARRQRLRWAVLPVDPAVTAYESSLAPVGGLHGLAAENLQARVRGTMLMALSNEAGHLLLAAGNRSEGAVGYSTLYGDTAGGFAPLADVPKTLVWELARWRNRTAAARGEREPIPEETISKAPSAELAPGQLDADRLPPYDVLDPLLAAYLDDGKDRAELIAGGFGPDLVDRVIGMVAAAEYKRRQCPPGPAITPRAAHRVRRMPITNRWKQGEAHE
jgi:NAD+ synthase (glutamine-hydrolysing)